MTQLMSQKAYAEYKGFSRQYVNELVRDGVLRLKRGKIDRDEADAVLEARREPARPLRRNTPEPATPAVPSAETRRSLSPAELPTLLLKTRIKSETEKARLLEIKAKVEAGKYIDRDAMEAALFKRVRQVRDNFLSIPDRLDAQLAAEADRHKIHRMLTDEIVRVLEDLSQPLMNRNS